MKDRLSGWALITQLFGVLDDRRKFVFKFTLMVMIRYESIGVRHCGGLLTSTINLGEESELSQCLVEEHFADLVVLIVSVCYILVC